MGRPLVRDDHLAKTCKTKASLTRDMGGTIFIHSWGGMLRILRSILALLLLGTASCVFALPRVDLPETAFNEADAPVNVAPPVRSGIRVIQPAVDPIAVLPTLASVSATHVGSLVVALAAVPTQRHPHSLQDLLCTFLI